jgi:hypothetical protein
MSDPEFWEAIDNNDVEAVTELLRVSPDLVFSRYPGEADKPGYGYSNNARALIPVPADFPYTNTALHTTAKNKGRAPMAELLLLNGADPNAMGFESNKGIAPAIVITAWEGDLATLEVLLDHGADPNLLASAESALYAAIEHNAQDKVDLLLSRGAKHDVFTASMSGALEEVKLMVRAYPWLIDRRSPKRNRTAEEEAKHFERFEVVAFLEKFANDWERRESNTVDDFV